MDILPHREEGCFQVFAETPQSLAENDVDEKNKDMIQENERIETSNKTTNKVLPSFAESNGR